MRLGSISLLRVLRAGKKISQASEFNRLGAGNRPSFANWRNRPIPGDQDLEDRSFAATVREAKAALCITGAISLSKLAVEQISFRRSQQHDRRRTKGDDLAVPVPQPCDHHNRS